MMICFVRFPQSLVKTKIAVFHRLKDVLASVHFREEALQTLVMVETWTREEAHRAIAALAVGVDGSFPTIVTADSPEGVQLRQLFNASESKASGRDGKEARSVRIHDAPPVASSLPAILVADPDPTYLQALKALLALHFPLARVDLAASVDVALAHTHARAYQAILSDMEMPGLDGVALMRTIQRTRPHTPVILVTTNLTLLPVIVGSGAFGFMRKPIDSRYCVTALQNAIRYSDLHVQMGQAQENMEAMQCQARLLSIRESQVAESKQQWR